MDGQVIRCAACGQANRVPALGSGKTAVCGKCKAPLGASAGAAAGPIVLTDLTFAKTVAKGSYVVDFWAAWCGPCRVIGPVIDELARERTEVTFAKLNVDENPRTSAQFKVQGIPLLVFIKDGAEVGRLVGAVPRAQIESAISRFLA